MRATLYERILNSKKTIYIVLIVHFILWLIVALRFDVHPDTADHWVWSRDLAWGYVVHPPAVAFTMKLATLFGGNSVLTLKFGAVAFSVLILWLAYHTAKLFVGRDSAIIFILLLECTPYFALGSVFWHIDQPYMASWLICLWGLGKYIKSKNLNWLLFFGLFAGFGALSKYITILIYLSFFLWCLLDKHQRHLLLKWQTWTAGLISLAVFSPNIYWNATNGWATFRYQLGRGTLSGGSILGRLPEMTAGHLLLFSFIFSVWAWTVLFQRKIYDKPLSSESSLLVATSVVPLLFFSLTSLRASIVDPHWLNVSYFSLYMLFAAYLVNLIKTGKTRLISIGFGFHFSFLLIILVFLFYQFYNLTLPPANKFVKDMMGWKKTANEIESFLESTLNDNPGYIVSREYQMSGALSLYLSFQPLSHSIENPEKNVWSPVSEVLREGAILVCFEKECPNLLSDSMERFNRSHYLLGKTETLIGSKPIRKLLVFIIPGDELSLESKKIYQRRFAEELNAILKNGNSRQLEDFLKIFAYASKGDFLDDIIERAHDQLTEQLLKQGSISKTFDWYDRWNIFDPENLQVKNKIETLISSKSVVEKDEAEFAFITNEDKSSLNPGLLGRQVSLFDQYIDYLENNPECHWEIFWKRGALVRENSSECVNSSWENVNTLRFPIRIDTYRNAFRLDPPDFQRLAILAPTLIVGSGNSKKRIKFNDRFFWNNNMGQARNGILKTEGLGDPFFSWKGISPEWFKEPSKVNFEAQIFPEFFLRITDKNARQIVAYYKEKMEHKKAELLLQLWEKWKSIHLE